MSSESHSLDDRVGPIFSTTNLPDCRLEILSRIETLTNTSMLPAHLIALNMEHVYIGRAARLIQVSSGVRVSGMIVDCVYYKPYTEHDRDVRHQMPRMRFELTTSDPS